MLSCRLASALLLAASFLVGGALVSSPAVAQPVSVSLPDAIEQGLVEAEFIGTGSASGASVRLRIARRTGDELSVTIPAGVRLLNADPTEQDMVLKQLLGESTGGNRYTPLQTIELLDDQQRTYILEGYCLEAELDNPSDGAIFTYDGFVDSGLIAVLNAVAEVRGAETEIIAIQAAIWALTDDLSRDELDEIGYELSDRQLEIARSLLAAAGYDPSAFRLFR